MSEKKFHEWISSEFEKEADDLERRLKEREAANQELAAMKMPDDSFDDLMRRIEAGKKAETDDLEKETGTAHVVSLEEHPASGRKPFRMQKRVLLAVAAAAVLVVATGVGATGAKLFVPKVENSGEDGEFNTTINSGDVASYEEVTEDEAYQEIEDRLGIQALRLGSKPQEMVLDKVYIDENMGEAQMEFIYKEQILTVYENKQSDTSTFETQADGKYVDTIVSFFNRLEMQITESDRGDGEKLYSVQIEHGNAYYYINGNLDLEIFETILNGIYFESV